MADATAIQWCDTTVNPTMGCDGCELWNNKRKNCYAGVLHERYGGTNPGFSPQFEDITYYPGRMRQAARASDLRGKRRPRKPWLDGHPRLFFVSDMSDALSKDVPFEFLKQEIIDTVTSPNGQRHVWLWLTKRPQRMAEFCDWLEAKGICWPKNLWPGTSITTQATANRIHELAKVGIETTRRFISVEPQWEALDLQTRLDCVDWCIQGGESGHAAKPFETDWALELQQQCLDSLTPYFCKQLGTHVICGGARLPLEDKHGGDWSEWPDELRKRETPNFAASIQSGDCREFELLEEIVPIHGTMVRKVGDCGKIPIREVRNFASRAVPRQRKILAEMRADQSYHSAYKLSADQFDTRHWDKVAKRAAEARGRVITVAAGLHAGSDERTLSANQIEELRTLGHEIHAEATELSRRILRCDFTESTEETRSRSAKRALAHSKRVGEPIRFLQARGGLKTASSKLAKTSRDVPQMLDQIGENPTVSLVARTLVEIGRIVHAVPLLLTALESSGKETRDFRESDPFGIGHEYTDATAGLWPPKVPTRRIATHRQPDMDALTAAWIVERYLFPEEHCRVDFVDQPFDASTSHEYDAVVDVGRVFAPESLAFDHKPPAFPDRNSTCATRLVWRHALAADQSLRILKPLVELIHDGDAITRRSRSKRYQQSRQSGLHALYRHAKAYAHGDRMLYQAISVCLDGLDFEAPPAWFLGEDSTC